MLKILGLDIPLKSILLIIENLSIGIIVFYFIKRLIKRILNKKNLKASQKSRIQTFSMVLINITKYIIVTLVSLSILSIFGVNVKSVLTGLGIGTAIISLAFQDIAKDLIAGVAIITEGSYEIGDTIEIDGFLGEVVFIGLRTTRIRNFKGATKIISNRYMDNIINYSNNNSLAVVDVSIAYECKEEYIEETFNKLFKKLNGTIPDATKDIECWGVNSLDSSGVIYRIVVETKPMKHFAVERYLKKEIKKALDEANIKIPYNQIEVHNG